MVNLSKLFDCVDCTSKVSQVKLIFLKEKKRIHKEVGINVFVRPKVTRTKTLITHIY